ncbi:MAG: tetratricopeptide repeat protein [Verrucomicrobia bacterium]|nr:tetratricopeptide repeat protein [Verrucomicrobiota bacterium]
MKRFRRFEPVIFAGAFIATSISGFAAPPKTVDDLSQVQVDEAIHSKDLFKTDEFVKSFTAAYGFLPDVEPKLNEEEIKVMNLVAESMGKDPNMAIGHIALHLQTAAEGKKSVSAALYYTLGQLFLQKDEREKAIGYFKKAIESFESFRRAHNMLGLILVEDGKFAEAIPYLTKAIELGEKSAQTNGFLGVCFLSTSDFLAAEAAYRQAFMLDSERPAWREGLVQALLQLSRFQEAAAMLDTLIAANPGDAKYWKTQANAFIGLKQPMQAAENFEILRHMGASDGETMMVLGDIYMLEGMTIQALGSYVYALESGNKMDIPRLIRTTDLFLQAGALNQAADFVKMIKSKANAESASTDDMLSIRTIEAKVARRMGDDSLAGGILEEIVKQDPGNMAALIELGQLCEKQEKFSRAVLYFEQSASKAKIVQNTDMERLAVLSHGQMLVRLEKFGEAMPLLTRAYELKKSDGLDRFIQRVEQAAERVRLREQQQDSLFNTPPPPEDSKAAEPKA